MEQRGTRSNDFLHSNVNINTISPTKSGNTPSNRRLSMLEPGTKSFDTSDPCGYHTADGGPQKKHDGFIVKKQVELGTLSPKPAIGSHGPAVKALPQLEKSYHGKRQELRQ